MRELGLVVFYEIRYPFLRGGAIVEMMGIDKPDLKQNDSGRPEEPLLHRASERLHAGSIGTAACFPT